MTTEEKFLAAVNVIKSLPKDGPFQPSYDLSLKFKAFYKQATNGPCNTPKPSFFDRNKYEWYAWKNLGNMSKEIAMEKYIEQLSKVIETMSYTEAVSKFIDLMGPFYEIVWPEEASAESGDDSKGQNASSAFSSSDSENRKHSSDASVIQISDNSQEPFEVISHQSVSSETLSVEEIEVTYHEEVINPPDHEPSHSTITSVALTSDTLPVRTSESSTLAHEVLPMLLNLQKSLDKILRHIEKLEVQIRMCDANIQKTKRNEAEAKGKTLTPLTLILVVLWPFVVHWVVYMVRRRKVCRSQ